MSGSGCRLCDNLCRTVVVEPVQYCRHLDEEWSHRHLRQLAQCELERARACARAQLDRYDIEPFSVDEQRGFKDGFVDFLDAGGTGRPPPLPPRRYWKKKFQTPEGQRAVQDWYRGFEHGAVAAQASGYRQLVTVPVSDAIVSSTRPYYPRSFSLTEGATPIEGKTPASAAVPSSGREHIP
jgi:hypothetical protein